MFNGVSAFWVIFSLTVILFGFQNCGTSNIVPSDLVVNASLNANSGSTVSDTGYYGGQNFKFSESENGQTLQELNVLKTSENTIQLSNEKTTSNCNMDEDEKGLESIDSLIKFSDKVRVTHPHMLTKTRKICSELDASNKRQRITIGDEAQTVLITRDSLQDCLMDDPFEILDAGKRVFIVSNLDHSEVLDIIENAEQASESSDACKKL